MPFLRALNWLPVEGTAEEPAAKEHRGSAWACVCGLPPPL